MFHVVDDKPCACKEPIGEMLVFAVWVVSHDVVITIPIEVPRGRAAFVIGPSKPLLNQFRLRPKARHNGIRADAPFMCSKIDLSYPLIGRYPGLSHVQWKPADLLHNSLTVCHDRRIARISGNEKFSVESQIGPGTPEIVRWLLANKRSSSHVPGTSGLPSASDILGAEVRFRPDFVGFTPRNRPSW